MAGLIQTGYKPQVLNCCSSYHYNSSRPYLSILLQLCFVLKMQDCKYLNLSNN